MEAGGSFGKQLSMRPNASQVEVALDDCRPGSSRKATEASVEELVRPSGSLRNNFDLNVINDFQLPIITSIFLSKQTREKGESMEILSKSLHESTLSQQDKTMVQDSGDSDSCDPLGSQAPLPPFSISQDSPASLTRNLPRLSIATSLDQTNPPKSTPDQSLRPVLPDPLPVLLVADDSGMDTSSYPEFLLSSAFPGNGLSRNSSLSLPFYRRARDAHNSKAGYVEKKIRLRRQRRRHDGHAPQRRDTTASTQPLSRSMGNPTNITNPAVPTSTSTSTSFSATCISSSSPSVAISTTSS
jgi:hypothetical protein